CVKIMATGGVTTDGVEPGSPQLTLEEMKAAVDEAIKAGKITAKNLSIKSSIVATSLLYSSFFIKRIWEAIISFV
ncbi:hypothetical protein ACTPD5_22050, partial [Clostridioides difficile]